MVQDKIFYSALLASSQAVTVTVGGVNLGATWTKTPSGGAGIYHGSVDFGANTGAVVVTVGSMTVDKRPIKVPNSNVRLQLPNRRSFRMYQGNTE